jgi:hypothetical protein
VKWIRQAGREQDDRRIRRWEKGVERRRGEIRK